MSRRAAAGFLAAFLLLALAACNPFAEQNLEGEAGGPVISEQYLQYQVERATAIQLASVFAPVWAGNPKGHAVASDHDPVNHEYKFQFGYLDEPRTELHSQHQWFRVTFESPIYDPNGGHIVQGKCHELPGGGTQQTGEFSTIDNLQGNEPIEHRIEKTITEESSTSVSFSESVELSNKTTIEAGEGVASVSDELTTTFGFSSEQAKSHTTTTEVKIEDTVTVPANAKVAIVYVDNDSAIECDVDIAATMDWKTISISPGSGFCDHYKDQAYRNRAATNDYIGHGFWGDDCRYDFKSWLELEQFMDGQNIHALQAKKAFSGPGIADRFQLERIKQINDPSHRYLSFKGSQRTNSRKDASYRVIDVSTLDSGEIEQRFGDRGPVNDGQQLALAA